MVNKDTKLIQKNKKQYDVFFEYYYTVQIFNSN